MKKICAIAPIDRVMTLFIDPQMKKLADNGFEVTIICDMSDEFLSTHSGLFKCIPMKISRGVNPINLVSTIIKLRKIFINNKYDIIQYTGPSTGLCSAIAGAMSGINTRLYCLWGIRYVGFKGLKRYLFKRLERITCLLSTKILLDSKGNMKFGNSEKLFETEKATVVLEGSACGIDLNIFDAKLRQSYRDSIRKIYTINESEFVIGYLGRLINDKGISELLTAAKSLVEKYDNITFMMVGNFEESDPINQQLYEWALSQEKIIFCGFTNEPHKFYASFDLFVFPSYREGFGGGVIQAAAFGVPAVVSDIAPLLDSIDGGNCGVSAKCKDSASLYEAIEKLYLNEELRVKLGKLAYDRAVEKFDQSKWLNEYHQLIASLRA